MYARFYNILKSSDYLDQTYYSDQDKFEVYEYKDNNNNENARLVYNLKLRCRVSTYCDMEFTNSRGQMIILDEGRPIQNRVVENFNTTKMANQTIIRKGIIVIKIMKGFYLKWLKQITFRRKL